MAFSESLASVEPWTFSSIADLWSNEAFARENETLTKALQISLSPDSKPITADADENTSFRRLNFLEPALVTSASDPETSSKQQFPISNRKISKRKSRVSKRSPTTFIAADPANFRLMVQQVTGKRLGDSYPPVPQVLKPEPVRQSDWLTQNCRLPTLDTSALLLEQKIPTTTSPTSTTSQSHQLEQQKVTDPTALPERHVSFATVTGGGGSAAFDYEKLHQSFPTLESWGAF